MVSLLISQFFFLGIMCIIFLISKESSIWMFQCVWACVYVYMRMNICMSMWVTHHYPVPWDLSSDAHLSALLLRTEPSEPSAVYTLLLLLFALSLFISLTHAHAHLFSPHLSRTFSLHLPVAPCSTSPFLTHSTLSCVLSPFSLTTFPPSLFIAAPLCIYLCRSSLIQTQTVSNSIQFCPTLRVSQC